MESNKNLSEQNRVTGGSADRYSSPGHATTTPPGSSSTAAPQRAREIASEVGNTAQTAYNQTKKAVSDAVDKTSEVISSTYDQTMTYGRQNPGKLTLIAFGAGIGIGVLLASGFSGRRSATRYTEPIVNALSQVALEFFR